MRLPGSFTLVTAAMIALLAQGTSVADWTDQSAVGLELGLGGVLTRYSPDAADGGSVLLVAVKGSYDVSPDMAVALLFREWALPGSNHASMPGVGARFEPYQGAFGRAYVDGSLGVAWTQERASLAYDIGGGFEIALPAAAGVGLGPFARFGQVVNPSNTSSDDGRALTLGIGGTFHIGRWSAANTEARAHSPRGGGPVRPFQFKVQDSDHDGVSDEADQCPEVPAGRHPDAFRAGCPENDEDGDGIPDGDDMCPATPAGDRPDRARRGCPLVDSDGDGIADFDDHCPDRPGPASRDPLTNGCPVAREAARTPEQKEAADKAASEKEPPMPNPSPKRHLTHPPTQSATRSDGAGAGDIR